MVVQFRPYLLDGHLEVGGLVVELSPDVDVGGAGAHGATSDEATLNLQANKHLEIILKNPNQRSY